MSTNFSQTAAAAHLPFLKKLGQLLLLVVLTFLVQQHAQAQYLETFSTPNKGYLTGNTDDFSGVNWTLSTWSGANRDSDDFFQTNANGQLVATDLDQQVCWESPLLDIAGTGANSLTVFLGWSGFDSDVAGDPCDINVLDHIAVYHSIDGGSYVLLDNVVGGALCSTVGFSSSSTPFAGAGSLLGPFIAGNSTLKIKICANASENAESITIDNVSVPAMGVTICNNLATWYADADGDGFGNPNVSQTVCTQPSGYVSNDDDCDDSDDDRFPSNPEICDGKDNDCNLVVDDVVANCAAGYRAWTGAVSTDWHTACNWSPACVPTAADDVIVQNVATDPEITAAAVAKSVTVESGAMLTISSAGSLTINGSSGNGLTNYGTVQNSGEITIGNTASGGLFGLDNNGTFNHNSGTINIDNSGFAALRQNPAGSFTNFADIVIGANTSVNDYGLIAYGLFSNQGNIQIDRFSFAGLLPNQSTSDFQNFGLVTIGENASPGPYSIFNSNDGSVVNQQCGEFRLFAPYLQQSTSDFTNYGLMRVNTTGAHSNDNLLTNHGIIEYPQGNPIPGVTNNEIIAAPISGGCAISPALSLGTTVDFDIATNWFLDENLTMPAGTFNEMTNTFSNTNLTSGTPTTVYFEIEDAAGGCTRVVSIEITSTCTPTCSGVTVEISGDEAYCPNPGNFITLTALVSGTPDTYLWDDGSTDASRNVSPTATTTYFVTATDADGCTATESFTVSPWDLPSPVVTGTNLICSGESTTLTVSGGDEFEWSTGDMDNEIETGMLTVSTTYTVTATSADGCTLTAAKTVFVRSLPVVNITGVTTLCEGQNTKLTATLFNSTYLWDPSGATTSSITVAPLTTTTYTVTLTSNTTGCSNTGSVTVNLTGPCTCESNNLFTNADFENGKTGWNSTGSVLVTSLASEVHGGTKALKMCSGAAGGNQRKAALPQESYTFSGWAKGSGTNQKFVGVQFLGANLTVLQETNQTINSPTYDQFSLVVTAPEGTKWIKPRFSNGAGSGCLFVDDFCLVQTVLSMPKNGSQPATTQFSELDFFENENLEQPADASQLQVFPNPTSDVLNLNFSNEEEAVVGQVEVFNSIGQRVLIQNLRIEVGEESVLSVGNLSEGAYFLVFKKDDGQVFENRFVKLD